jgi:anti-sigma B factor antagonist
MSETVLELDGRLESSTAPLFQHRLSEASPSGQERLLLDLSRVTFIGSAALGAILVTAKRLAPAGGKLAICAPSQIARVFMVSGLDAVLPVHSDLAQARKALDD